MNNLPLVSIAALNYNQEKYFVETLDSIVNQSYSNIELIIIDDCSKDNSVELIKGWIKEKEVPCTFIVHEKNQGLCRTINDGLKHAKGKYFQAIACDDVMMQDKIERQVKLLEAQDNLAVVHSDAIAFDGKSQLIYKSFGDFLKYPRGNPPDQFKSLAQRNTIIAPSVLILKAAIDEVGGYDNDLCFEDWDMWLRLARKGYQFTRIDEPLVKYRYFEQSMSQGNTFKAAMAKDCIKLLNKHLGISTEIDAIIAEAQRPNITKLIEHNEATTAILWTKAKREKSAYSIFLFLCSLVGINQEKAHAIKSKLKR